MRFFFDRIKAKYISSIHSLEYRCEKRHKVPFLLLSKEVAAIDA